MNSTPDDHLAAGVEKLVIEAVRDCVPIGIAIGVLQRVQIKLTMAAPLVEAALESERCSAKEQYDPT